MALGPWTGFEESTDRDFVMDYLKTDHWVYRRYERGESDVVWLSLIASRDARSFHPSEVCYQAQGWAVGGRRLEPVPIGRGHIRAQRVVAAKNDVIHGVLYWYLWMDPQREVADGCVMVKITTVIADGEDWDVAFGRSKGFAAVLFSDVLPWHRY
jgi:EpsI family protein